MYRWSIGAVGTVGEWPRGGRGITRIRRTMSLLWEKQRVEIFKKQKTRGSVSVSIPQCGSFLMSAYDVLHILPHTLHFKRVRLISLDGSHSSSYHLVSDSVWLLSNKSPSGSITKSPGPIATTPSNPPYDSLDKQNYSLSLRICSLQLFPLLLPITCPDLPWCF